MSYTPLQIWAFVLIVVGILSATAQALAAAGKHHRTASALAVVVGLCALGDAAFSYYAAAIGYLVTLHMIFGVSLTLIGLSFLRVSRLHGRH